MNYLTGDIVMCYNIYRERVKRKNMSFFNFLYNFNITITEAIT